MSLLSAYIGLILYLTASFLFVYFTQVLYISQLENGVLSGCSSGTELSICAAPNLGETISMFDVTIDTIIIGGLSLAMIIGFTILFIEWEENKRKKSNAIIATLINFKTVCSLNILAVVFVAYQYYTIINKYGHLSLSHIFVY